MSKSLSNNLSCGKGCCSAKSLYNFEPGSGNNFSTDRSLEDFLRQVQETDILPGDVVDVGVGGVTDPLEVNDATIFNLLQAANATITGQLRIGTSGGLLLQNNQIISGSNIVVNPTGEFQINPNLHVFGQYTRLDTVETRITDKVPVIGYQDQGVFLTTDNDDRGFEFNYVRDTGGGILNYNRGFMGYDKSRERFVLWRSSTIDGGIVGTDQNYQRSGTLRNQLDIDEVYTAVIRDPDYTINGVQVNDVTVSATSNFNVFAPDGSLFGSRVIANSLDNSLGANKLIFTDGISPVTKVALETTSTTDITVPVGPGGVLYYDGTNIKGVTDAPLPNEVLKYNGSEVVWAPETGGGDSVFNTDVVTTVDGTPTTLSAITVDNDTTVVVRSTVVAYRTDAGSEGAGFTVQSTYRNTGGTLTQIQSDIVGKQRESPWSVTTLASGTDIIVEVTGEAGKVIEWANAYYVIIAPFVGNIGGIFITDSVQTTDNTPTTISTLPINTNSTLILVGTISSHRSDTNTEGGGFVIQATYRNTGGVLTQIQVDILADQIEFPWEVQTTTLGTDLIVEVVGQNAKTIDWVHTYYYVVV